MPDEGDVLGKTAVSIDPETTAAINKQVQSEATVAAFEADVQAGAIADNAAEGRAKAAKQKQMQKHNKKQILLIQQNQSFLVT